MKKDDISNKYSDDSEIMEAHRRTRNEIDAGQKENVMTQMTH